MSFTFGLVRSIAGEIPKLDPAYQQRLAKNGYVYDISGTRILAVLRGSQARVIVPSKSISPYMKRAIVAVEDRRFYEHRGVDVRGIARAVWADVRRKAVVQGGSTITQQFIKNAYVHSQSSIARKLKEAALAWQLEQRWSKDRILTAYLNTIYFGNGAYGVQQAAITYFHHGASKLRLAEAALLAGIPKDPARYDPVTNRQAAKARRALVLIEMFKQRKITLGEFRNAIHAPMPKPDSVGLPGTQGPAQYFVNYVKQQLIDKYGSSRVLGGGLRVRTSIDLTLQKFARDSIANVLRDPHGPSAALVAVDPKYGRILAMVGGNNYRKSQFNLAVQGERQPGSAFKPFVLATALEDGIAPDTELESKPVHIFTGDRVWVVHNYENSYLGQADLETATAYSDNSIYAQLTKIVGPAAVVRTARRLGISSPLRNYFSIGLGAQAVNPLEMARAFSAFANGGYRIDGSFERINDRPRAILSVTEPGKGLRENRVVPKRVLSPRTAATVTELLRRVVVEGTGRRAALPDRPAAGKTGTTEDYGDAWFVGYTPQLVAAVWVGYPNKLKPMMTEFHGDPVAGGTFPALIWRAFMIRSLKYLEAPPEEFPEPMPQYEVTQRVTNRDGHLQIDNGYCRDTAELVFYSGAGPSERANCKPNEVDVPVVVGRPVSEARAALEAQPLRAAVAYQAAEPRQRAWVVLRQYPKRGTLSSYDKVTLVVAKPTHGLVPNVVGISLRRARRELRERRLVARVVRFDKGPRNRVLFQAPLQGVAAAPGMIVKLVVGKG